MIRHTDIAILGAGVVGLAIAERIARLEEAVAARLFTKSPQGYALTEEGTRLLSHAERAEAAMEGAREALSGPEGLSGQIRIVFGGQLLFWRGALPGWPGTGSRSFWRRWGASRLPPGGSR